MATANPACTIATTTRYGPDGPVDVSCGCGWELTGFVSRRKAIAAHKAHRFPGTEDKPSSQESSR